MTDAFRVIEASSLTKSFVIPSVRRVTVREHALDLFRTRPRERLVILDRINFSVRRGEAVGLMGRNGSGKSTLLKILTGIYAPDSGQLSVRGEVTPILELGVAFNPELDVIDNVYLLGTVMGLSLRDIRTRLDDLLEFAELQRFARQKVQHLSSGMIARLAYAVAFSAVHEILVLDEIFAVGDAAFQARCEARFRELSAAGYTIVLVSHDARTVARLCTRAVLLERGSVVEDGPAPRVADAYLRLLSTPVE